MPTDSESSRLRIHIRQNIEEDRSMVANDECNADSLTWMNICDTQLTDRMQYYSDLYTYTS
jgi:hypothetical protein